MAALTSQPAVTLSADRNLHTFNGTGWSAGRVSITAHPKPERTNVMFSITGQGGYTMGPINSSDREITFLGAQHGHGQGLVYQIRRRQPCLTRSRHKYYRDRATSRAHSTSTTAYILLLASLTLRRLAIICHLATGSGTSLIIQPAALPDSPAIAAFIQ